MSGLKRTYKNIKDHNKKSGNSRSFWAFFSVMDSIFGEKAYIEPVAITSSEGPSSLCSVKNSENKIFPSTFKEESNELDIVATKPPEKKRRVDAVLNNYIDNIKNIMEERDKGKREAKALRETEKEKRNEKKRLDKERMQADKKERHESILALLTSVVEKDKGK